MKLFVFNLEKYIIVVEERKEIYCVMGFINIVVLCLSHLFSGIFVLISEDLSTKLFKKKANYLDGICFS